MHHVGVLRQERLHLLLGYLPLGLPVDLVAQYYERELLGFLRCTLVDELVLPRLQVLEALRVVALVTFALVMS